MTSLQADIERRLAHSEPDVEVLLAEVLGGRCLRVFIDHPDGVTLEMCERVTLLLNDLRERYSLAQPQRHSLGVVDEDAQASAAEDLGK